MSRRVQVPRWSHTVLYFPAVRLRLATQLRGGHQFFGNCAQRVTDSYKSFLHCLLKLEVCI